MFGIPSSEKASFQFDGDALGESRNGDSLVEDVELGDDDMLDVRVSAAGSVCMVVIVAVKVMVMVLVLDLV